MVLANPMYYQMNYICITRTILLTYNYHVIVWVYALYCI